MKTFSGHSDVVTWIVLMPNEHLASASDDKIIRIWDLDKNPPLIKTIYAHSERVTCLSILMDF
jgi:WD40 repeat protein